LPLSPSWPPTNGYCWRSVLLGIISNAGEAGPDSGEHGSDC
jgi:hypothetical protein